MGVKMKDVLGKLNDISIRNKLIIGILFLVLIPVLSVGVILTSGMRQMAINNAVKESETNVDRIRTRIQQILSIPTGISDTIYSDKKLYNVVAAEYKSNYEVIKAYKNYDELDKYLRLYREIKSIRFYYLNDTMLDNWIFMKPTKSILRSEWYKRALKEDGNIIWRYVYDETQNEKALSLIRLVKYVSGQKMGVTVITIDKDYLFSVVKQEPFKTIVANDVGSIVLSTNKDLEGKNIKQLNMDKSALKKNNGIIDAKYDNEKSKIIIRNFVSQDTNASFKIISIFPIQRILHEANERSNLGFLIIVTSLAFSFILILFFSSFLSKRINKLSDYVKKVFTEDFNVDVAFDIKGKDEIGQLSENIDTMVKNIRTLVYEVYEMDIQQKQLSLNQKEMQFKMLASQINPHFLYNALETIRMKAYCKGDKEIAHIVKKFAQIMRRNLEVSNGPVSLQSELDIISGYLEIQKFRFGDMVEYEINVKSDIENYTILPLIIQPIVENAFVHGLENSEDNGKIVIDVEKEDEIIKITVNDNGIGIEEKKLEALTERLNSLESNPSKRIGLANIYQRIKLYYGEKYGFSISSKQGAGTTVTIYIPATKEG